MKKLIVACTVALMAVVANANAIKWGVSTVSPSTGDAATLGYTAYLFVASDSSSTFTTSVLSDVTASLSNGDMSVLNSALAYANPNTIVSTTGKANWNLATIAGKDIAVGSTLEAFLIIIDDANANYLVAQNAGSDTMSKYVGTGTTAYSFSFGSQANNTNTWAEIAPEPTSGLLMLLGMGVLALRRRRA